MREQKDDPKDDEWADADTIWKGVYKGSAAKPRWVWTPGPKTAPAYLKFDNDAHTITIEGATKEQLNKYWIRILFKGAENLTPAPMWASSYAATRQTHQDRTPEHPNDLEQGDAVRYCTPWKLDGDREDGGLNIPRDVFYNRAEGSGTLKDPYDMFYIPGEPIVNFIPDDWTDRYDGPNRFLHYYTRWDIYNQTTKTWDTWQPQNLNAKNSYFNAPKSMVKDGTLVRAYMADRVDGGYIYFKMTPSLRPVPVTLFAGLTAKEQDLNYTTLYQQKLAEENAAKGTHKKKFFNYSPEYSMWTVYEPKTHKMKELDQVDKPLDQVLKPGTIVRIDRADTSAATKVAQQNLIAKIRTECIEDKDYVVKGTLLVKKGELNKRCFVRKVKNHALGRDRDILLFDIYRLYRNPKPYVERTNIEEYRYYEGEYKKLEDVLAKTDWVSSGGSEVYEITGYVKPPKELMDKVVADRQLKAKQAQDKAKKNAALAKTGLDSSTVPLAMASLLMLLAGASFVAARRKNQ